MTTFLHDLRYAARGLRRAPGFTAVAVLTLALGIGANAAMFGIVDALLFRPPSGVSDPDRVVRVQMQLPPLPNEPRAELSSVVSYPAYAALRDNAGGFTVRRELQGLDATIRFADVRPLANLIMPQIEPWRMGTLVFTLFGTLGLVLAAIGLYGVLSFLVAQRTREIGIRVALGASQRSVLALVLGQGARLIAIGVVVGLILGAMATQVFASMMFGISPLDPFVYVATALVLATIGMFAVYVPARRATQVDAMVALRTE